MKKIKTIILMIGSLFMSGVAVAQQADVTGLYGYRGGGLFILPQNQMVIMGYGTIITGKYIIENDELTLKFDRYPSVMAIVSKNIPTQSTKTTIEISSDLVSEHNLIGIDINLNQPIMTKMLSSNDACEGENLKLTVPNSELKGLVVALAENEFTGEPAVSYKIEIPHQFEKIKLVKTDSHAEFETVFKIQKNKLKDVMDDKVLIRQPFSAINGTEFAAAQKMIQYRTQYDKDLKIYQGDGEYIQTLKSEVVNLNSPKLNGKLKIECEVD